MKITKIAKNVGWILLVSNMIFLTYLAIHFEIKVIPSKIEDWIPHTTIEWVCNIFSMIVMACTYVLLFCLKEK